MKQKDDGLSLSYLMALISVMLTACNTIQPVRPGLNDTHALVAVNLQQMLSMQLGVDVSAVQIVAVEEETWPDSCIGKPDPHELCAELQTPGYRITLAVDEPRFIFHTNEDGSSMRLAAAPEPVIGEPILSWMHTASEGACQEARFSTEGLVFGRCGGVQMSVPYALQERESELSEFAAAFASFTADTPAGSIEFQGDGPDKASFAQQRMLAEWANLAHQEAQMGRSGASWGLVLGWHREGGIAGFCDDVAAYVTGTVYLSSCRDEKPEPLGQFRLDGEQLAILFDWLDAFAPFEYEWKDPAQADGMTVSLVFAGRGEQVATGPEQTQIVDFAQNLFNEGRMATDAAPPTCPAPGAGQQLLIQEHLGYCLLYPQTYSLWQQSVDTMDYGIFSTV